MSRYQERNAYHTGSNKHSGSRTFNGEKKVDQRKGRLFNNFSDTTNVSGH